MNLNLSVNKRFILLFPGLVLLFLLIVTPAAYQVIKGFILFVVIYQIILSWVIFGRISLNKQIFLIFIFFLVLGSYYALYGSLYGNIGSISVFKETVVYVFIYMILITGIQKNKDLIYIHKTLVFSTIFLCIYILITFLNAIDLWPNRFYYNLYEGTTGVQAIGLQVASIRGHIGLDLSSLPSFLFLQPYLVTYLFYTKKEKISIITLIAFILSTLIMIFCGRRILLIVGMICPIFILINSAIKYNRNLASNIKIIFLIMISIVAFIFILKAAQFDLKLYTKFFFDGFSFNYGIEAGYRKIQFLSLLEGWTEKPVFGFGSGAVRWEYIRDIKSPWNYELSYLKYLYDFGIIGFLLYSLGVIWIYVRAWKIFKIDNKLGIFLISSCVGSIGFLFGNITNPYLLKFDYLFAIFLPIGVLNYIMLKNDVRIKSIKIPNYK